MDLSQTEVSIAGINKVLRTPNVPIETLVDKAVDIAYELARRDPSKKWVIEKMSRGEWNPNHNPKDKKKDDGPPHSFTPATTPRFMKMGPRRGKTARERENGKTVRYVANRQTRANKQSGKTKKAATTEKKRRGNS